MFNKKINAQFSELSATVKSLEKNIENLKTELADKHIINKTIGYFPYYPNCYKDTQAISIIDLQNDIKLIKDFLEIKKVAISETKMVKKSVSV